MRVLFITRKYPPQTGGMENYSYGLITNYPTDKETIILNKRQIHLIWFIPFAFFRAVYLIWQKKIDLIHLGDAVLTPLGYALKLISGKKVVCTAHGLDINYDHWLYRRVMPFFFPKMDHFIAVSQATKQICIDYDIAENKISVIPNGVDLAKWQPDRSGSDATEILKNKITIKNDLNQKNILLSVGRLAKRKGFCWFIENVMPKLPTQYIYGIIGSGSHAKNNKISEHELIKTAIKEKRLTDRVFLLGKVDNKTLTAAYRASYALIMPNIPVEGDMEGFGIVAIEAGANNLPVVASRLEGIQDAVIEGQTGFFAETQNADDFVTQINKVNALDRNNIRKVVKQSFDWQEIIKKYVALFEKLLE